MDRPGMMKVEVTAKGGRGSKKAAIDAALENLKDMIDAEDMNAVESRRAPPPSDGMEPTECLECKDGTCTDPEHNEGLMAEMMAGMKD